MITIEYRNTDMTLNELQFMAYIEGHEIVKTERYFNGMRCFRLSNEVGLWTFEELRKRLLQ